MSSCTFGTCVPAPETVPSPADFDLHLALHRLDCLGSHGLLENHVYCREALAVLPEESLRPPRLLTGEDLIALGLAPGPLFREILAAVEDAQLNGEIGDPEQARAWVRARWGALPQLLP